MKYSVKALPAVKPRDFTVQGAAEVQDTTWFEFSTGREAMFHLLEDVYEVGAALVTVILIASMLFFGVVGPAWEGTKSDRSVFWAVFVPCLAFSLAIAFWLGQMSG